jgi:hypothetical protein
METRVESSQQQPRRRGPGRPFPPGNRLSPGRPSVKRLAAAEEAERQAIEIELLGSLGRAATPFDRLLIAEASALATRCRALRRAGKFGDALEYSALLFRVLSRLDLSAAASKPQSYSQRLAAELMRDEGREP